MCRMEFGKIWDSQELFGYFAWPTAGRLPDGRLIVVCSGFRMRHVCPFGKVTAFYSDDEGKTWSSPAVLSSSILDNRDAGLCVSGGKVLLTTFTVSRAVQRKYMDMWYRQEGMEKENAFILSYLAMTDDEEELRELGSFIMEGDGYRFGKRRHMPGELSAPHGRLRATGRLLFCRGKEVARGRRSAGRARLYGKRRRRTMDGAGEALHPFFGALLLRMPRCTAAGGQDRRTGARSRRAERAEHFFRVAMRIL